MIVETAGFVLSRNGRDAGKRFIVIGIEEEIYALIADGKTRSVDKPKRKKIKHLKPEGKISSHISMKISSGEKITNNEIRRALAEYSAAIGDGGNISCRKTI